MDKRRVVVTGLGVVSPLGSDLELFWKRLVSGYSAVRRISHFDPAAMDTQIAAEVIEFDVDKFIAKKEQRRMDPFCHFAVSAAKLAVADAGLDFGVEDPTRVGVLCGSGIGGLLTLETQHSVLLERGPGRCSPFMIPQMIVNMAAGLIAIDMGLKGVNYSVVSACASGAHCIGEGLRAIQHNDAEIIVAGGSEAAITPLGIAGFCAMKAMSTRNDAPEKASRPFDATRDGFVMGEGAGILVLEELEHARRRGAHIYCELAGYGATCDASHITAPAEGGEGAARCMQRAMADAGVTPDDIDYINAHGTSTPLNDKSETQAIKTALGPERARRVMVSSTKSMTGHLLGAAGGLESVICALAIQRGVVPPTINYENQDPECDLDYVPNTAREQRVRVCLNNSLGFGGHNATLLFREFK